MHEKLVAIIAEAAGEFSMCWEKPERAGKFLSEEAHTIIYRVVSEIEELYGKTNNDSQPKNTATGDENDEITVAPEEQSGHLQSTDAGV